jgi:hypothetical protein
MKFNRRRLCPLSPGKGLKCVCVLVLLILLPSYRASAQSRQSGEIRGTVTDVSGAVLGGVQVAITNVQTGVVQQLTTDSTGVYEAPFVQPGEYSISFEKEGFKAYVHNGIVLHVETIKVDATLKVGSITESVTVTALQPLVQTENAERGLTLSTQVVEDVPNVGRSWDELLGTLPGVNGGGSASATGQGVGVNGQTAYQSNWQIDGGIAMLGASQNPDILQPPLDTIEEVDLSTANFGAERGTGLSVFNVTTKSGTNKFHGKVFEYVENDKFDAENYFQDPTQTKPALRWNEFGFTLGGPIKRNKAFFYGSFQGNPTSSPSNTYYSYPSKDMRGGNFSALCQTGFDTNGVCIPAPPGSSLTAVQLYDPATTVTDPETQISTRLPFQNNQIPIGRLDSVAKAIQQYFPTPQTTALYNNYNASSTVPIGTKWFTGKVDYDLSRANRLTGSFMMVRQNTTYSDPICSIDCLTTPQHDIQAEITDVWTISAQKVNEFRVSLAREHFIADDASMGKGYPAKLKLNNPAGDLFPDIMIGGVFYTTIGVDAAYFGGPAIDAETTIVPSNNFTWVKGNHIFKFGGEFERWRVNTGWPTANEGNFDFGGGYASFTDNPVDQLLDNPPSEGTGYADFFLGLSDSWYIDPQPVIGARNWSAQSFAQDEYKITPNLTLTLGLRYIIQSGWSETQNRISGFQPNIMNPATDTPGALWFAGQLGHNAPTDTIYDFFAPRFGFAWAPRPNMSIRGGFGIYNVIAGWNTYASGGFGQGWAPIGSLTTTDGLTPVFKLSDGPPAAIYPSSKTLTPDMLNGQSVNYPLFHSPLGYSEEYQLSIQRQFKGLVADVGYVGNRGIHLAYTRNIDQVPANELGSGNQPYPQYLAVHAAYFDGISNYNALQTSLKAQLSHGLLLNANYTWSKTMDEITNSGFVGGGGGHAEHGGALQNQYDPRSNYAPSTTDFRHFFNGSFVYELPFGKGMRYPIKNEWLNSVAGGWEISSLFQLHSGMAFTPYVGTANNSGALAGSWRPNRLAKGTVSNPTINEWFDPSAFEVPAANTFGNSGRNILYGPRWNNVNGALLKNFAIKRLGEKSKLQFKAEASNLFNHPNFGLPDAAIGTGSAVGTISSSAAARTMQFGASLAF